MHHDRQISFKVGGLAIAACLVSSAVVAQQYLPPSRYSTQLPSPQLLYPKPLYSPGEQVAPLPDPVMLGADTLPPNSGVSQRADEPLYPHYAPEPSAVPSVVPFAAPIAPPLPPAEPMAMPASQLPPQAMPAPAAPSIPNVPGLLPLPPAPASMPQFKSLTTLENVTPASAPIPPEQLQRQPLPESAAPVPASVDLPPAAAVAPIAAPSPAPATAASLMQQPIQDTEALVPPPPMVKSALVPTKPVVAEKEDPLDPQTRAILSRIPGGIDSGPRQSNHPTQLNRFDPDIEGVLEDEDDVARHEAMGVAIEVRRPNLDVNVELQQAYEALMGGQPQLAVQAYKDILRQAPRNLDALFGVATTYHRMGETALAKPFYQKLLKLAPTHRDGLTNFLSLVAQEAPEDATSRLEYLAVQNPDFSAIPALLGVLYDQMGEEEKALDSLIRAVRMEPNNVAYKYNLAILYDQYGHATDATTLYNQLLAAGRSGIPLPVPMRDLQERVIYINNAPEVS